MCTKYDCIKLKNYEQSLPGLLERLLSGSISFSNFMGIFDSDLISFSSIDKK